MPRLRILSHQNYEFLTIDWFAREVIAARVEALVAIIVHRVGSESDDWTAIATIPKQLGCPITVKNRHLHVHENYIERLATGSTQAKLTDVRIPLCEFLISC